MRTYGTCRRCKAKLLRADYVRFGLVDTPAEEKASGVSTRTDGPAYAWIHKPCPQCGEPRPMSRRWRSWALLAAFAALFALGLWAEFGS